MANKFGVPEEKWPTVYWLLKQGWENSIIKPVEGRKTKGTFIRQGKKYMYNYTDNELSLHYKKIILNENKKNKDYMLSPCNPYSNYFSSSGLLSGNT